MPRSVVIIGPAYPLRGGLASYNERLGRQFMQEGWKTTLYTFTLQYPSFLFPGTTQYSSEPAPTDLNIRVCINSVNPINWLSVGFELKRQRPDLIVVRYWLPFMGPCLGTILRLARSNGHTRVVCIADNVIPHEKRPGDNLFTRYFLGAPHGFVTMSEKVLQDLRTLSRKPAQAVHHPLYDNFGEPLPKAAARQRLSLPENENILLFFGFIRRYKGLDILLDAIGLLQQEGYFDAHPLKVMVAGEFYEDEAPYTEQIDRLGIREHLYWHVRFIPDSEVRNYLSAADGVIQPYRSATQSGVTPLAYHFGVPMIVTRVGGLGIMVPEQIGVQCDPDPGSVAEAIKAFFIRDRQAMQDAIARERGKYAWSNITAAILSLAKKP